MLFVCTFVKFEEEAIVVDGMADDNKVDDPFELFVDWDVAFADEDGVTVSGIADDDDDDEDVAVDDTARLANAFVNKLAPTLLDTDETILDPFGTLVEIDDVEGDIWVLAICGVCDNGGIMPVSFVTTAVEINGCSVLWVRTIDEELFDDDEADTADEADKDLGGESFVGNDEVRRVTVCCWTCGKEWAGIGGIIDCLVYSNCCIALFVKLLCWCKPLLFEYGLGRSCCWTEYGLLPVELKRLCIKLAFAFVFGGKSPFVNPKLLLYKSISDPKVDWELPNEFDGKRVGIE